GQLLLFYNILFGMMLMAIDKQRQWSIAAVAAALINPALNLFLIPFFQHTQGNGGIGAALATEAIELLLMTVAFFLLPRDIFTLSNLVVFLKALSAGLVMIALIWLLRNANVFALLALGATVYVGLCFALGAIRQNEVSLVISAVVKRQPVTEGGT
ncbi:MAG: polysaccharide biosynthesis C-terminal domain-containing protein, partial [Candidatus Marsarchaeota archaeon]|nr:polysaccharide biosynthesis C-terminal domain-containing protein [Candidatus Marsarchaeota archaeon]